MGEGFRYRNLGYVVKVLSYRSESSKNQVSYAPQTLFSLNQLLASELGVYPIDQIFSALNLSKDKTNFACFFDHCSCLPYLVSRFASSSI